MKHPGSTPKEYIDQLPEERRKVMTELRKVIKNNIPKGFREEISYGMPGWVVPHSMYPDGYHGTTDPWDWKVYLFCINCHKIYDPDREGLPPDYGWANHVHRSHRNWSGRCTYCHVRRVHGSQMHRLIGGEHEGYKVLQFTKQSDSLTGYSQSDCLTQESGNDTFNCGGIIH